MVALERLNECTIGHGTHVRTGEADPDSQALQKPKGAFEGLLSLCAMD